MKFNIVLLLFTIWEVHTAPSTGGPVKIDLLTATATGLMEQASNKFNTLSETALKGVNSVNNVVTQNFATIGETINNGLTATAGAVQGHIETASGLVNEKLDSAGKFARQATDLIQDTASQGVKVISDGATAIMNQKSGLLTTAFDTVRSLTPLSGPFSDPPRKLESAVLEQEDFNSKVVSAKESVGNFLADIFQPVPLVDTIKEEEKYGNAGDKFEPFGRTLVNTSENFLGFISNLAGLPTQIIKQITRSASEKLNNFGGRLIGLA